MVEPPEPQRIFLSHTAELRAMPRRRPYVSAAEAAVTTSGHVVADMAYLPAVDRPPADVCRDAVLAADALVLIAGFRYGSLLPDASVSHTEWELLVAENARIPRLVFMLDDDAEGGKALLGEPVDAARQLAFRDRLRRESGLTVAMVDSPGSLQAALLHSLHVQIAGPTTPAPARGPANVVVRDSEGVQIGDRSEMTNFFNDGTRRPRRYWWFGQR